MVDVSLIDRPETRQHLIASLPNGLYMAELGVFAGDFAADLLDYCQPSSLHLFDRWDGDIVCGDQNGEHLVTRHGNDLYEAVRQRFLAYEHVWVHRAPTSYVRHCGLKFDFIYVDADHAYQSVLDDLRSAEAALVPSGANLIGGHDYTWRFPGVIRAVDQFCLERGWRISALTQDGCPSYLLVRE